VREVPAVDPGAVTGQAGRAGADTRVTEILAGYTSSSWLNGGMHRRFGYRSCGTMGPRIRPEVHFAMLIHPDAIPAEDVQIGWVCQDCGVPTREPSTLMGRAWCTRCERYGVPTQVASAA
jgi:hypothetical protein